MSPVYNWMTTELTLYKAAHPTDTKNAPNRWNFIRLAKRRRICGLGNRADDMVIIFPNLKKKRNKRELCDKKLYLSNFP